MKTFFRYVLPAMILLSGVSIVAWYVTVIQPRPPVEGTVELPGLSQPVRIHWDAHGVPHIEAGTEEDLYMAVGYVHARDRLWQLTLNQLILEGRFAEFFGEEALPLDRFSRTMGFLRTAKAIERETSPEQLRLLDAYTRGINAYVTAAGNRLPIEFSLTGVRPWAWTPAHTLGVTRLMGWTLTTGWWSKAALGVLQDKLPADDWGRLVPGWPAAAPTSEDSVAAYFLRAETAYRHVMNRRGTGVGSNGWVVAGSRTASGMPLLAGDPHLGLDMPGFWYEAHLMLQGRNVSGATVPGAPYVVLGQNDHLAWTFTSLMADNADFFRILPDPADPSRYVADSSGGVARYKPFILIREMIPIKGGAQEAFEIRLTEFGPVINGIHEPEGLIGASPVALRWTGHDVSHESEALYRINQATTFESFQDALPLFGVTGLNMIYADVTGNIAMFTIGHIPIRRDPLRFRNSWEPADQWQGLIPFAQLPRIINPASGFISNANNPPVAGYPSYLTTFWEPESRQQRIIELLEGRRDLTADDMSAIQTDVLSAMARELTPLILPALQASGDSSVMTAIPYLLNWTYRYDLTETAPSVFDMTFHKLSAMVYKPVLGEAGYDAMIRLQNLPIRLLSAKLTRGEVPDSLIVRAVAETLAELEARFGTETSAWRWENLHTIRLDPPLFREAANAPDAAGVVSLVVNNVLSRGPFPAPGNTTTINNGQYDWRAPFEMTLGASIRRVVDLSDLARSRSVLPTGQSGDPLSPHFGDQTGLWLSGKTRIFEHHTGVPTMLGIRTLTLQPPTTP
jgi:penicillin G amidase